MYYPGEPMFAPDVMVLDLDTRCRELPALLDGQHQAETDRTLGCAPGIQIDGVAAMLIEFAVDLAGRQVGIPAPARAAGAYSARKK